VKKLIIIIISLASCLCIFGQNPNSKTTDSSKRKPLPKAYYFSDWSLGLSAKSSVENILPNLVYSKAFEFNYQPKFSYEIEVFIERKLQDNWVWVSGINFHNISFEYNHIFPINFSKSSSPTADGNYINEYNLTIDNSFEEVNFLATAEYNMFEDQNDYEDGEALDFRVSSVNSIRYLGIPLAIKKVFGYQKLNFTAKGGIEPSLIIQTKINYEKYHQSGCYVEGHRPDFTDNRIGSPDIPRVTTTSIEMISQASNLKKFQLNGFINIGLSHTFKYHTFFLEAEYKRGFSAFSQKNNHTSYLNSYGFKTGFIKRFKESKLIDLTRPKQILRW